MISAAAAANLTPVSLELGGKGANLVFADADLQTAVDWSVRAIFTNAGQVCLAGSRLYVQRPVYDEFLDRFRAAAEALVIGDPKDRATQLGPLASAEHYRKVRGYVEAIEAQGGKIVTGGLCDGWVVRPTVVADAPADAPICREEIFGPVVVVHPFDTEAEGVAAANDTRVRPECHGVHREPVACPPGLRRAAGRHHLGELFLHPGPARAVRRRRRLRRRPRGRHVQPRVLHRAQGRGHGDHAAGSFLKLGCSADRPDRPG